MKIKLSRIKEMIQEEYFNLQKEAAPDETDLLNQIHHDTNATPEDIKQFVSGKSPVVTGSYTTNIMLNLISKNMENRYASK